MKLYAIRRCITTENNDEGVTMTKIEFLKYLAKSWFGNAQQHSSQNGFLFSYASAS